MTFKNLLLSPHDDDAVLFAAFTCLRDKPLVMTVTDAHIQTNRGEVGCDATTRARETREALRILECKGLRLNIRDDEITEEILWEKLDKIRVTGIVYAPALQGGNRHHDMVNRVAHALFPNVIEYTTYTPTELYTTGNMEVIPTKEELELKNKALECYVSQKNLPATRPHFEAVKDKSEWLIK